MRISAKVLMCSCAAVAALGAVSARAQSAGSADQSSPQAATPSGQVQEVIVTAQKRSENLQDVPIAVTTAKGSQLAALGLQSAADLKVVVPSLTTAVANGYFTSNVRGVGSAAFGPGVESAVAVYIDGVYLAGPIASELMLNNIASVEVLKGPQGTLFGRNATGGLIQITTDTPTQTPHGHFSLSYGNYGILNGAGYISGGITPDLAADFAVTGVTQSQGYGKNFTTGQDTYRVDHNIDFRSKWVWTPSARTTLTFIADYYDDKDNMNSYGQPPGHISPFTGLPAPNIGPYNSLANVNALSEPRGGGVSLRIDHDASFAKLSSITAYRQSSYNYAQDIDAGPEEAQSLYFKQPGYQFSQELQANSTGNGKLKWTAGLFYFQDSSGYQPVFINNGNGAVTININATENVESAAAYAQGTYEILPDTRLTLGGRYTEEWRQSINAVTTLAAGTPSGPVVFLTLTPDDEEVRAGQFTYRVSLDHRFSDTVLGYASFNTGFKSGGYNADFPPEHYAPEKLTAYEVGLKSELFDRRIRLNLAGFYYDYKNIQIEQVTGSNISIINGAAARVYGMDLDATAVITPDLSVTGGLELMSPTFTSFPAPNCPVSVPMGGVPPTPGSCTGKQLPFASKFTLSAVANYTHPLAGGMLLASASLYYNSGEYFESDNVLHQGAYTQINGSIKWKSNKGYSIGIFGKNLTDARVLSYGATTGFGQQLILYQAPLTYGVTLGYDF